MAELCDESTLLLNDETSLETCDAWLDASEDRSLPVFFTSFFVFDEHAAGARSTEVVTTAATMHLRADVMPGGYPREPARRR